MNIENKKSTILLLVLVLIVSMTGIKRLSIQGSPKIRTINSDVDRQNISVTIIDENNKKTMINFNNDMGYPAIINGRTYVPLRIVSEYLGYDVKWDQANWKVSMSNEENNLELIVGENHAMVNGKKVSLDNVSHGKSKNTKSFISDSRTYVPLRFISEAFGAKVDYSRNSGQHYITISMGKKIEKPVKGEWIEPKFHVDALNRKGSFVYELMLLNQKTMTKAVEAGNDIHFKVKWNKKDWEDYLYGYSEVMSASELIKFDFRNDDRFNEAIIRPNGNNRKTLFFLSANSNLLYDMNKKPRPNPAGKTLKLNVEVTQNGVTKTYPFEYKVK